MSLFQSLNNSSDSATELGKKYSKTSIEYVKFKSFYLSAKSLSLATKVLLIGGFCTLTIIFLAVSGAIALGSYLNNLALGFLLTACILFLIMLSKDFCFTISVLRCLSFFIRFKDQLELDIFNSASFSPKAMLKTETLSLIPFSLIFSNRCPNVSFTGSKATVLQPITPEAKIE